MKNNPLTIPQKIGSNEDWKYVSGWMATKDWWSQCGAAADVFIGFKASSNATKQS